MKRFLGPVAFAVCALVASAQAQADSKPTTGASFFSASQPGSGSALSALAAGDVVVNVGGIESRDGIGALGNVRLALDATPGALVDLVSWNVNLTASGGSYLSEMAVTFTNNLGAGVTLRPGSSQPNPGTGTFSGSGSLVGLNLAFNIGTDGKLYLEFHETFDDVPGATDGTWNSGTLTFGAIAAIPEPSTYGMLALGLLAVGAAARRRRQD